MVALKQVEDFSDIKKYVSHPDIYFNHNPLVRYYFNEIFVKAINIAKPKKEDVILDFGCGKHKQLKCFLGDGFNYYGYDIVKEWSDFKDFSEIIPDITLIFALSVFEHLTEEELRNCLSKFRELNTNPILITAIPFQNMQSEILKKITGIAQTENEHKLSFKEINRIISNFFILEKSENFLNLIQISRWRDWK